MSTERREPLGHCCGTFCVTKSLSQPDTRVPPAMNSDSSGKRKFTQFCLFSWLSVKLDHMADSSTVVVVAVSILAPPGHMRFEHTSQGEDAVADGTKVRQQQGPEERIAARCQERLQQRHGRLGFVSFFLPKCTIFQQLRRCNALQSERCCTSAPCRGESQHTEESIPGGSICGSSITTELSGSYEAERQRERVRERRKV